MNEGSIGMHKTHRRCLALEGLLGVGDFQNGFELVLAYVIEIDDAQTLLLEVLEGGKTHGKRVGYEVHVIMLSADQGSVIGQGTFLAKDTSIAIPQAFHKLQKFSDGLNVKLNSIDRVDNFGHG